jgi:hypothetical protein
MTLPRNDQYWHGRGMDVEQLEQMDERQGEEGAYYEEDRDDGDGFYKEILFLVFFCLRLYIFLYFDHFFNLLERYPPV